MKQGLVEYVLVTAFFALAAAGGLAIFGDELRAALGVGPPAASAPAQAAPAQAVPAAPPPRAPPPRAP